MEKGPSKSNLFDVIIAIIAIIALIGFLSALGRMMS